MQRSDGFGLWRQLGLHFGLRLGLHFRLRLSLHFRRRLGLRRNFRFGHDLGGWLFGVELFRRHRSPRGHVADAWQFGKSVRLHCVDFGNFRSGRSVFFKGSFCFCFDHRRLNHRHRHFDFGNLHGQFSLGGRRRSGHGFEFIESQAVIALVGGCDRLEQFVCTGKFLWREDAGIHGRLDGGFVRGFIAMHFGKLFVALERTDHAGQGCVGVFRDVQHWLRGFRCIARFRGRLACERLDLERLRGFRNCRLDWLLLLHPQGFGRCVFLDQQFLPGRFVDLHRRRLHRRTVRPLLGRLVHREGCRWLGGPTQECFQRQQFAFRKFRVGDRFFQLLGDCLHATGELFFLSCTRSPGFDFRL